MADVLNRTTLQFIKSVNTPDFPVGQYVINPNFTPVTGIPDKYWNLTGDILSEKSPAEKAVVDQAELDVHNAEVKAIITARLGDPIPPLQGIANSVTVQGLNITVNVDTIVVDDVTTVTADETDTKQVKVCCVYNSTSDTFSVVLFEKTTGLYDDLASNEDLAADFGEWEVVANGTDLTPA